MKNLAKAVIAVMKEVKNIEKNDTVGTGKSSYKGVKDSDVKVAFNDAFTKHGLCILPIGVDEETQIDRWEEKTNWGDKQKQSVFTKVKTKYLLLHESGESVELAGYGHGVDAQDKGAGKATTYALKNALLYAFMTPSGAIDDTDKTHSNDIEPPRPNKTTTTKTTPKENVKKKLTDAQLKTAIAKFSVADLTKTLTGFNCDANQIRQITNQINKLKTK